MASYAYLFPWLHKYISDGTFIWTQKFAWWPRRSSESNQRIWLTKAWYGYRYIYGLAGEDPVKAERWLTEKEYMIWSLSH